MKFLRTFFIVAILAFQLTPGFGYFPHGYVAITTNNARVTQNWSITGGYLNLVKGFNWTNLNQANCASPPCLDSNGYPNSTPSTTISTNSALLPNYYGTYTFSWSGAAAFEEIGAPPAIYTSISPLGAVFNLGAVTSGDLAPGNHLFATTGSGTVTNPSIVFQYGWNIQSIQNDGSGHIQINTKTNFVNNSCYGAQGLDQNGNFGSLVNISGANSNTGANGTWAYSSCSASSFVLTGSTFTNAQASAVGTATIAGTNLSYQLLAQGTWSGFTNFSIARTGDLPAIASGHLIDATLVSQTASFTNPNGNCATNHDCGWYRFMNFNGTQTNLEKDFSARIPTTAMSYVDWQPGAYWVGQITNGGSGGGFTDNYTASNPSGSPSSGEYVDGEVVYGYFNSTNSGAAPSLALSGRSGAAPILTSSSNFAPQWIQVNSAAASAGLTLQFSFSATWLNSGSPYTFSYTTTASGHFGSDLAGANILGANLDFAIGQDATLAAGLVYNGNTNPSGQNGVSLLPRAAAAGALSVSYTSGPAIISVGTYIPSALSTGTSHIQRLTYNYLLGGWLEGIGVFSPPMEAAVDLCNQAGCNVYWNFTLNSASYVTSVTQLFANNLNSGLRFGFETGNEAWNCFGPQPCPTYQTLGNALGLTSSSDQSNFSYACLRTAQYQALVSAAWTSAGRSQSDQYTFIMSQAANNGVGSAYDQYQLQCSQVGTSNSLVASYGAVGGGTVSTNFAATGNRAVDAPHVAIGMAPYWGSAWFGSTGSTLTGTVAANAPWLTAVLNYAQGSTSTAFTELANTFNGTTTRTDGLSATSLKFNTGSGSSNISTMYTSLEAIAAEYDSYRTGAGLTKIARFDYEGGPQWAFGNNAVNGTNSSTDAVALSTLESRFNALTWNVSPYTLTGTPTVSSGTYNSGTGQVVLTLATSIADSGGSDIVVMSLTGTGSIASINGSFTGVVSGGGSTVTYTAGTGLTLTITGGTVYDQTASYIELASETLVATQAWKNSSSYASLIQNSLYQQLITTSGANREVHGAEFGYSANIWGFFPGDYHYGNNYANFTALQNQNAGN